MIFTTCEFFGIFFCFCCVKIYFRNVATGLNSKIPLAIYIYIYIYIKYNIYLMFFVKKGFFKKMKRKVIIRCLITLSVDMMFINLAYEYNA